MTRPAHPHRTASLSKTKMIREVIGLVPRNKGRNNVTEATVAQIKRFVGLNRTAMAARKSDIRRLGLLASEPPV